MPGNNIETYTNNIGAPRADSAGSEAFEIEGRHIEEASAVAGQAIGRGVGQAGDAVQNHFEIQDTSKVSADGAQAFAALSKSLSTTMQNTNPNDADQAADSWRAQMDTTINNVGADVATRAGLEQAERVRNTLRDTFTSKSMAYQSTLSAQAVLSNLSQTKDGLAQAVSNDPTSLPTAIAYLRGAMADQLKTHSFLSAEDLSRVQSEFTDKASRDLGIAAFDTMAEKNPAGAKAALSGGYFAGLFSGQDIKTLQSYADMQSKAQIEAQKAAVTQQKEADTQAFRQTSARLTASMIQPDGTLKVPPDLPQQIIRMSRMPNADGGEIRALADMARTVNKANAAGTKAATDPPTYSMFNQKMLAGQLSDADVYQARADGHLSDRDTSYFIGAIKNLAADPARRNAEKDFAGFTAGQKPAFTHGSGQISVDPATGQLSMGSSDPVGAQNYANFYRDAQQQYNAAYDRDPKEAAAMLDPKSPSYLGRIAPQYLQNKKSADFQSGTGLKTAPNQLTKNEVDGYVADPKNEGKYFTVEGQPGKRYGPIPKLPAQ